jgi:hypothetical protein
MPGRLLERVSGPSGRLVPRRNNIASASILSALRCNTERLLVGDSSVELRRLNQTLAEMNKTLNRQNAILEKILRWMVVDHKEAAQGDGGREAREVPGGGEADRPGGPESGPSPTAVQPRTPSPRELAQASAAERFIQKLGEST